MKNVALRGKPYAGNPHERFDEGKGTLYPQGIGRSKGAVLKGAKPRRKTVFAFAIAFAAAGWGVSFAATWPVSTPDELTNAVTVAASGDTISLAPGKYDLTGRYMEILSVEASSPIAVSNHLTSTKTLHFVGTAKSGAVGHWNGEVVLKGDGRFYYGKDATASKSTFENLTFEGFSSSGRYDLSPTSGGNLAQAIRGGAICMNSTQGAGLATNCVFRNCKARCAGAVAYLTQRDCLFEDNWAYYAGGASLDGSAYGCMFRRNSCQSGCGAYWWPIDLQDCVFEDNLSETKPGAVSSNKGRSIVNCRFARNRAKNGSGGAMELRQCSVISNCVFEGNVSDDSNGGAIFAEKRSSATETTNGGYGSTIVDCSFLTNSALKCGGAIYAEEAAFDNVWDAPISIVACAFTNNTSTRVGKTSAGDYYSKGGAVYGGTVSNCTFVGNSAVSYAGAYCNMSPGGNVDDCTFVSNCVIKLNFEPLYGGAVHLLKTARVTRCRFIGNVISSKVRSSCGGAALSADAGGTVRDCVFVGNCSTNTVDGTSFSGLYGSIVRGASGHRIAVEGCAFTNNYTVRDGIVMYGNCSNVTFYGNEALQGGGTVVQSTATDCRFVGNRKFDTLLLHDRGTSYCGAAYANEPGGNARDSELLRCDLDGGVIYHCSLVDCHVHDVTNKGDYCVFYGFNVVSNCLISRVSDRERSNTETDFRGIWYRWGSNTQAAESWDGHPARAEFVNCTFADSDITTGYQNEALLCRDATGNGQPCDFLNCLFYNNRMKGQLCDFAASSATTNGVTGFSLSHCVSGVAPQVTGGTWADLGGNAVIAPDKLGILTGAKAEEKGVADYTLRYGSPARGLGEASIWSETATDLAGNLRKRDGKVDPGCYECWIDPTGMMLIIR